MSGQQPPYGGPRGWNPRAPNPTSPSPSSFLYRPPSPWTPVAPSPPPIISGPRHVPMSPTRFGHGMSPAPQNSGSMGGRGLAQLPYPRPQWPPGGGPSSTAGNKSPAPYQSPMFQQQGPPLPPKTMQSPTPFSGNLSGPRPFRPIPSPQQQQQQQPQFYGNPAQSSFQLSPTPSPMVCQTPNSEFMFNNRPNFQSYETQQQQQQQQQQYQYQRQQQRPMQQPPMPRQPMYEHATKNGQFEYAGAPPEPLQPNAYVIYDDEEEYGPSTAEIIANQSQDYVDEKLAEYQMTSTK